jgi:hypothetical protein
VVSFHKKGFGRKSPHTVKALGAAAVFLHDMPCARFLKDFERRGIHFRRDGDTQRWTVVADVYLRRKRADRDLRWLVKEDHRSRAGTANLMHTEHGAVRGPVGSQPAITTQSHPQPSVPQSWKPMADGANFWMGEIPRSNSAVWADVCARVRDSLPGYRVSKVRRVQNKYLWREHQNAISQMTSSIGEQELNMRTLFHSFGTHALHKIVKGTGAGSGLNPNASNKGEYGACARARSGGRGRGGGGEGLLYVSVSIDESPIDGQATGFILRSTRCTARRMLVAGWSPASKWHRMCWQMKTPMSSIDACVAGCSARRARRNVAHVPASSWAMPGCAWVRWRWRQPPHPSFS